MLAEEAGDKVHGQLLPQAQDKAETVDIREGLDRLFGIGMPLSVIILFTCWSHIAVDNIFAFGTRLKTLFVLLMSVVCSVVIFRLCTSSMLKQMQANSQVKWTGKIDLSCIAKLRSLSAYVIPICLVFYHVRIVAQICQGIWFPKMPFRDFPWCIARVAGNGSASVIVCFLLLLGLLTPYWVSLEAIKKMIRKIESEDKPDWFVLTVEVHLLDRKLEQLWSAGEAGGALLLCFGFAAIAFVPFAYQMLFDELRNWHFAVLAFALAICLGVAFMCAHISSLCQNNSSISESLEGAARRYPARLNPDEKNMKHMTMTDNEKLQYLAFLDYVRTNKMGAEVIGVHITTDVVISLATRAALGIPTIYAIMARLAQSSSKDN